MRHRLIPLFTLPPPPASYLLLAHGRAHGVQPLPLPRLRGGRQLAVRQQVDGDAVAVGQQEVADERAEHVLAAGQLGLEGAQSLLPLRGWREVGGRVVGWWVDSVTRLLAGWWVRVVWRGRGGCQEVGDVGSFEGSGFRVAGAAGSARGGPGSACFGGGIVFS